jgi:hypothetical protein
MSLETEQEKTVETNSAPTEHRPWRSPEDMHDWKRMGRVRTDDGELPRITAVVDLDDRQSDWVRREAQRAGLSPVELLKRLVDEARVGSETGGATRPKRTAHR